jgi:hypothetical protein
VQDGRIFIELINGPFLFELRGTPDEYSAGLRPAIERDWLQLHESGTYVKFTPDRHGAVRLMECALCEDTGWVCENHHETPWDGEHACTCGGARMPCPIDG